MKASFAALRQEIAEALGLPVDHIGVMHRDLPGNLNWNVSGVDWKLPKPLLFNAARFAARVRARKTPDQEEWTRLIDRLILEAAAL